MSKECKDCSHWTFEDWAITNPIRCECALDHEPHTADTCPDYDGPDEDDSDDA